MQVLVNPCQGLRPGADVLQGDYPMLFSVGVGRNAPPWYQPSGSGKEIVFEPLEAAFVDSQHPAVHVASDAPEWFGSRPDP